MLGWLSGRNLSVSVGPRRKLQTGLLAISRRTAGPSMHGYERFMEYLRNTSQLVRGHKNSVVCSGLDLRMGWVMKKSFKFKDLDQDKQH